MSTPPALARPLGTMVAYGFAKGEVGVDLAIATAIGATVVEVLPDWRAWPDPRLLRDRVVDLGLVVHSAHGCWGAQSISAPRVDLGDPDPLRQRAGIDDLRRCIDWLSEAAGTYLVVHPGGLSDPTDFTTRRAALASGLGELADHARGTGLVVCVENMPRGVHPGSRMSDLATLVGELDRPELALALDTGHAHIVGSVVDETLAAGPWLRTTHVHDNNGRQDAHEPPGLGTIDWQDWTRALDQLRYAGPIMLECIRHLRAHPEDLSPRFLERLAQLTRRGDGD